MYENQHHSGALLRSMPYAHCVNVFIITVICYVRSAFSVSVSVCDAPRFKPIYLVNLH